MMLVRLATLILPVSLTHSDDTVLIPMSCQDLEDGYHYLKLLENEPGTSYPIMHVQCSNGYAMIDYAHDSDWTQHFTSWIKYHYAVAGPIRGDDSNWSRWFLPDLASETEPADQSVNARYLVSPECETCDDSKIFQVNGAHSAYYMSALAFGCFDPTRGWPACDMDYETYTCKVCEWDAAKTQISSKERPNWMTYEMAGEIGATTGVCDFEIRASTEQVTESFPLCATRGTSDPVLKNWKPSLGTQGAFCQCYHPYHDETRTIAVSLADLEAKQAMINQLHGDASATIAYETDTVTELYQSDFAQGTYRITTPGTYVIMEDIEFDFNGAPEAHPSPNNIEDNFWWPSAEMADLYPGAGDSRDPYFLGFFAGIAIEVGDVMLDLNGHELRMSVGFYYQQPYFSIIELANQAFLPQQGPGLFGTDPVFATDVTIRNGVIGLSAHHGIHGNNNERVVIEDIIVRDFQTHGIQLNGFDDVVLRNTEIGPSVERAYLNGNYGQFRLLLPTFHKIAKEYPNEGILFDGRTERVTMQQMLNKVIRMMDMVYDFAVTGTSHEGEEYWDEAVDAFVNPSGLPYGAVLYGLFLNYPSAGIFGWHVNDALSTKATLENVYIHDLRHKGIEVVGMSEGGRVICNAFNGPIPSLDLFGTEQADAYRTNGNHFPASPSYKGTIITDMHLAMFHLGKDDWDNWPGIPFYGYEDGMITWALGDNPDYVYQMGDHNNDHMHFYCNEDAMFHPAKGLLGLKLSGADEVVMKNVNVQRLQDETPLGSHMCGEIIKPHGGYHFAQQSPYQVGFSMNMVMAMTIDFSNAVLEDITIEDVFSATGLVYGLALWYESALNFRGELNVNRLVAGFHVDGDYARDIDYESLPNKAMEACAVRLYDDSDLPLSIDWDTASVQQTCIEGMVGCLGYMDFTNFDRVMDASDGVTCDREDIKGRMFDLAPTTIEELEVRGVDVSRGREMESEMEASESGSWSVLPSQRQWALLLAVTIVAALGLALYGVFMRGGSGRVSGKEWMVAEMKERDASENTRLIANKGEQYMVC